MNNYNSSYLEEIINYLEIGVNVGMSNVLINGIENVEQIKPFVNEDCSYMKEYQQDNNGAIETVYYHPIELE